MLGKYTPTFIRRLFYEKLRPWPVEKVHDYWKNRWASDQKVWRAYGDCYTGEAEQVLLDKIMQYAAPGDSIMELGCGTGRLLWPLYKQGLKNLSGVELSREAVNGLKARLPEVDVSVAPIEDIIKTLSNYDLVFTFSFLSFIPPKSEWAFREIARITDKYLIVAETIKNKVEPNWQRFPRDYKNIFEKLGLRRVDAVKVQNMLVQVFVRK